MRCTWCYNNEFVVCFNDEDGKLTKVYCSNCEEELNEEELIEFL